MSPAALNSTRRLFETTSHEGLTDYASRLGILSDFAAKGGDARELVQVRFKERKYAGAFYGNELLDSLWPLARMASADIA